MIAQQLMPPGNPEEMTGEELRRAIAEIKDALSTKTCFPDIPAFIAKVERHARKRRPAEDRAAVLEAAIGDLSYIESASSVTLQFLRKYGGIDEPTPYYSYFDAIRLSKDYLSRVAAAIRLGHPSALDSPSPEEPGKSEAAPNSTGKPAIEIKPVMNTKEVASYIGRAVDTVRHYVVEGSIPFHRQSPTSYPYYLKDEIDEWLRLDGSRRT